MPVPYKLIKKITNYYLPTTNYQLKMKGIILAGGKGTRLLPFTKFTNKHLLPVHDRSMILYPLETLKNSGIREILIVTDGKFLADFKKLLGDGRKFGVKLSFAIQKKADGIAGALKLSEKFSTPRRGSGQASESIAVILGDNIFEADPRSGSRTGFRKDVQEFKSGAKVFLKKVSDPERFGVAELRGTKVMKIIEKPKNPQSNLAVVGLYFYDENVFDIIKKIEPSKRGELEITDVNNFYIQAGKLEASKIKGFWSDAGTLESLAEATRLVREKVEK